MAWAKDSNDSVVTLATRRWAGSFPAAAQIEAYWEGLRRGRPMPARADLEPRGMEAALEHAFVAERIAPGLGRFRLAGMHLADLMGCDVRGMPVSALILPEARARLSRLFEEACASPARITLSLQGERGLGRGLLEARLILLPLAPELGQPARLLGCLQAHGGIGRQPRRFSITDTLVQPISAPPLVQADGPESRASTPDFREHSAEPVRPRQPPRLRLVQGGAA